MSEVSDMIRREFKAGDDIRDAGLTTPDDIKRFDDIVYGDEKEWQVLDVYKPLAKQNEVLPVIVSVHGGGWVYGDKERYQYYCMNLAKRGFAVVNFTYRLAPEYKFPASVEDTNLVIHWIFENATEYGFDLDNIFMVGDSAGAHNLGIYSTICTNKDYAAHFNFAPPEDFVPKAVALNCGAYVITVDKNIKEDLTTLLMGDYLPEGGSKEELNLVNFVPHMNEHFPPTYVLSAVDCFLKGDVPVITSKLTELEVEYLLRMGGDKNNRLSHVFHCNIKLKDAKIVNDEQCEFFKAHIG